MTAWAIVGGLLLLVFIPLLVNLASTEISEWSPRWAIMLVHRAVRGFVDDAVRERYREEWLAEIAATPGKLSPLWTALTITWRAADVVGAAHADDRTAAFLHWPEDTDHWNRVWRMAFHEIYSGEIERIEVKPDNNGWAITAWRGRRAVTVVVDADTSRQMTDTDRFLVLRSAAHDCAFLLWSPSEDV